MRVAVVGAGAVGGRIVRRVAEEPEVTEVLVCGRQPLAAGAQPIALRGARQCGFAEILTSDVAVLASPAGTHLSLAERLIDAGTSVVSTSDHPEEVRGLLSLGPQAAASGVHLLAGAAFSPGLTCVLARHAADSFSKVAAVHVSRHGTAGPACARRFHAALKRPGWIRRNGVWLRRQGGSGREISWFPDPIGPSDCYFGELSEPWLLARAFPDVPFLTARRAASRQDRLTSRLPMLTAPVIEGALGAVRVEVRGLVDGESVVRVLGATHGPAAAAASVSTAATLALLEGEVLRPGAFGLAEVLRPLSFLSRLLAEGIQPVLFEGSGL